MHRTFSEEDILKIAETYHNWRKKDDNYEDVKGFCRSASLDEITKHNFVLTPGRYVGIKDEEDDGIPFEEKMADLTKRLSQQIKEEKRLNEEITKQLKNIGSDLKQS